jgi:hypothetical protein
VTKFAWGREESMDDVEVECRGKIEEEEGEGGITVAFFNSRCS